ncbi:MAG: aromatic ring-hydroxylating oxygenase subunit alpha [Gammaproteobacteria bacterium]
MSDGGPVCALEARFYSDLDIFAREQEAIFFKTWQYACHVSEVENAGDYVVFDVAGQSLFVIRDALGELRCFYNVCQHRAHELLQDSGHRKVIRCPYHAWTYELDGALRGAPNSRNVPGFDKSKICLSEVRVEVFCGFVFVNLDAQAAPMAQWYGQAETDLRGYVPDIDSYKPVWTHAADEDCNWKVAVENYNECYHCRVVHPSFTRGVIAPETVNIVPREYTLRHSAQAVSEGSYEFADGDYRVIFLWPAMSIQVYPGQVVSTYWWRTRGAVKTEVFRGWLTRGGENDPETMKIAEIDRDTTFAEDLPVLRDVQRGLASRGYRPGPLVLDPKGGVENELSIKTLHTWVREALGED